MSDEFTRSLLPQIVIAAFDGTGRETFLTDCKFLVESFGDFGGRAWLWQITDEPSIPNSVGSFPQDYAFPTPGGVKFCVVWVAPAAVGTMEFTEDEARRGFKPAPDPRLHMTDTVDFAVVLKGEAQLLLPEGQAVSVRPGSIVLQAGIQHGWHVTSDEPLVLLFTIIGAKRAA
jgi:hypothetical protein